MPYVMVPVPEEHVEDVMQFILRARAKASQQDWDQSSISTLFNDIDEAARSLLAFVARATLEGTDLTDADAARRIQLSVRELSGITNELAALAREANRPNLVDYRGVTERLPNGRTARKRVVRMTPEVAELVRAAEEEELATAPHPLAGTPG